MSRSQKTLAQPSLNGTGETYASVVADGKAKKSLRVEEELGFYASFHSNSVNKAIHFVCIPLILWSSMMMLAHIAVPGTKLVQLAPGLAFRPNFPLIMYVGYQLYYLYLEPIGGLTYIPVGSLMYLTATSFANHPPAWLPLRDYSGVMHPSSFPFALALHVGSWIAQFIGHGVFEKRAPALMTSLTQALVLAPFFVHLEMLFTFFDYKPDLHKKMINAAGKRIRDMNQAAAAKMK